MTNRDLIERAREGLVRWSEDAISTGAVTAPEPWYVAATASDEILGALADALEKAEGELAVRRKDDEEAAGALLLPLPEPGSDIAKMFRVRRQLLDRAEKAEAERDREGQRVRCLEKINSEVCSERNREAARAEKAEARVAELEQDARRRLEGFGKRELAWKSERESLIARVTELAEKLAAAEGEFRRMEDAWRQRVSRRRVGCSLDTNGDGDCQDHPRGCAKELGAERDQANEKLALAVDALRSLPTNDGECVHLIDKALAELEVQSDD